MLNRFLPRQVDNTYHGYKVALWLFAMLVLMRLVIGFNSIFNGRDVATSADGIPLDRFGPAGAQAVVSLFALLGCSLLMMGLLCILVLVRYRALVPFMFALLLLDNLGRRMILQFLPIATTGAPPGNIVTLILLALMIAGLVLSLLPASR
ncbi:MAG: hypothetical protein ACXVJT_08000 [Thermoanaerobaculia bacterium]